jgi:hypothetical protein
MPEKELNRKVDLVSVNALKEQLKDINSELKQLSENAPVLSYGFKSEFDATSKFPKTGFVNSPNMSYIAQLESEMNTDQINEENLLELDQLKKENEKLRAELENIKSKK